MKIILWLLKLVYKSNNALWFNQPFACYVEIALNSSQALDTLSQSYNEKNFSRSVYVLVN